MHRNVMEAVLGAVVILVAAMFLGFAYQFSTNPGVQGYDLLAEFRHIDGVKKGDEVRLAGVKIGSVTNLALKLQDYSAVVTMRVEPGIKISADSAVIIHTDGLLGGKYLEIQVGGEDKLLEPGQRFSFVQDAVIVEELIEKIINFAEAERTKNPAKK